jgi:hypothetical protein
MMSRILAVVLAVLLIVLAIAVSLARSTLARSTLARSTLAARDDHLIARDDHLIATGGADNHAVGHDHTVGMAMHKHATSLGSKHIVGVHPLDSNEYSPLVTRGGARAPAAKRPWAEYETWDELNKDAGAVAAYIAQRAAVLNNPDLDWAPVLAKVNPLLIENREYIGIINIDKDGKTLHLSAIEASPTVAGTLDSETAFASVPGDLVAKYAEKPGLFIFHTHPSDPRGSPLPSSHDLAAAVYFGAVSRFAANVVISRYGVLVYGPDWGAYKALHEAKDWNLALLNLSHDVVAAHESIRSWSTYTIADYIKFYPRHRLLFFYYPTSEMVGDMRRFQYLWNLETPIDHDLISDHSTDIKRHRSGIKANKTIDLESKTAPNCQRFAPPPEGIQISFE